MKDLIPQAEWCVGRVIPEEEGTYKGTIIVPRQQSKVLAKAELLVMGPKALKKLQARPGDIVYHNKDIGHKFQENDENLILLAAGSVYCVVKDQEVEEKKCCGKCKKEKEE